MRTWIAAMLLASTMAVPAYAQDHDQDGRDGGHHRDQGNGGQHDGARNGAGQGGQRDGGGRQGANPVVAPAQVQQVQPQQPARTNSGAVGQRDRGPGNPGVRPGVIDGGDRGGGDPRRFDGRVQGGVQIHQGQPGGGPGYDPRQQGGRDDHGRPVVNGGPAARDWNGNWRGGGEGQRGDRGQRGGYDQRGDRGQGWNGGRPGGDRQGGGDWNRGWRQDGRYNWQGYRSQHRELYRVDRYRPPYGVGWGYRRFSIGFQVDPVFFAQDYWISNPSYYRLPPAYGPYRWVRYYNDALLIDLRDGRVIDAIPDFFY